MSAPVTVHASIEVLWQRRFALYGQDQNGVVVLDGSAELPEGTPVTVVGGQGNTAAPARGEHVG